MLGQKLGHQVKSKKNVVYALEAIFSVQYSWKLLRIFALIIFVTSSKMGHDGWKTRSLGQILDKPCVSSRSHIFSLILLKVAQNVCFDDIWVAFENGSCGVKI